MALNIPLARKVLEFIESHPEDVKHDQHWFYMTPEIYNRYQLESHGTWADRFGTSCGTVACIAGTACLLAGAEVAEDGMGVITDEGDRADWQQHAQEVLGFTDSQVREVFWNFDNQEAVELLRGYIDEAESLL